MLENEHVLGGCSIADVGVVGGHDELSATYYVPERLDSRVPDRAVLEVVILGLVEHQRIVCYLGACLRQGPRGTAVAGFSQTIPKRTREGPRAMGDPVPQRAYDSVSFDRQCESQGRPNARPHLAPRR